MPIYEYRCQACGKKTELIQRMGDPPLATCPQCGGEVKKLISSPAVQFKGTGWDVTDYAGKGKGAKAGEGGKPEGGETKAAEKSEKSSSSSDSASASGGSTETKAAKVAGSE